MDKVIKPDKIVTDTQMLKVLAEHGIDKDYVEFCEDYTKEHPCAKFYRDLKSNRRFMVASGLPMVNQVGEKIVPRWIKRGRAYFSAPNTFSASVSKGKVRYNFGAEWVEWNPQLFLNNTEIKPKRVSLLAVDPTNENYHQNVLEWDYGICKRRIRIIQDRLRERWIFESDPRGKVRIKHNHSGKFKMFGTSDCDGFAIDAEITDDEEIVSAEALAGANYPIRVGGSPETFYSDVMDGRTWRTDSSYSTAHDTTNGEGAPDTDDYANMENSKPGTNYYVIRGHLYFDTSGLPDTCTITAATLSLNIYIHGEANAGHGDLGVVEGTFDAANDGLAVADFGAILTATTLGAPYLVNQDIVNGSYNDMTLNATGIGWISKTGWTKFALRLQGDINDSTPAGVWNRVYPYLVEKGTTYRPKLVVTYTAAAAFIPRVIII